MSIAVVDESLKVGNQKSKNEPDCHRASCFCVAALLSLGMVMLYSSSMTQVRRALPHHATDLVRAWPGVVCGGGS